MGELKINRPAKKRGCDTNNTRAGVPTQTRVAFPLVWQLALTPATQPFLRTTKSSRTHIPRNVSTTRSCGRYVDVECFIRVALGGIRVTPTKLGKHDLDVADNVNQEQSTPKYLGRELGSWSVRCAEVLHIHTTRGGSHDDPEVPCGAMRCCEMLRDPVRCYATLCPVMSRREISARRARL